MAEQIRELLRSQPFAPFTVLMFNGVKHQVRHPENALLSKHFLVVTDADKDGLLHNLYLLHVAELQVDSPSKIDGGR